MPFLVDTDNDVTMYETNDIIDYIRNNYSNTAEAKPRIHTAGAAAVCVACEG